MINIKTIDNLFKNFTIKYNYVNKYKKKKNLK